MRSSTSSVRWRSTSWRADRRRASRARSSFGRASQAAEPGRSGSTTPIRPRIVPGTHASGPRTLRDAHSPSFCRPPSTSPPCRRVAGSSAVGTGSATDRGACRMNVRHASLRLQVGRPSTHVSARTRQWERRGAMGGGPPVGRYRKVPSWRWRIGRLYWANRPIPDRSRPPAGLPAPAACAQRRKWRESVEAGRGCRVRRSDRVRARLPDLQLRGCAGLRRQLWRLSAQQLLPVREPRRRPKQVGAAAHRVAPDPAPGSPGTELGGRVRHPRPGRTDPVDLGASLTSTPSSNASPSWTR